MIIALLAACGTAPAPAPTPAPAPAPVAASAPVPASAPVAASAPMDASAEPVVFGMKFVDWACAVCDALEDLGPPTATATSTLKGPYGAEKAFGSLDDAWCEGEDGPGVGAKLTVTLGSPAQLDAVAVWGGYFKSEALLRANHRLKKVRLTSDAGADEVILLADPAVPLKADPSNPRQAIDAWFPYVTSAEPPWHGVKTGREEPVTSFTLEILEVWPGEQHEDTCIARVEAMVVRPGEE